MFGRKRMAPTDLNAPEMFPAAIAREKGFAGFRIRSVARLAVPVLAAAVVLGAVAAYCFTGDPGPVAQNPEQRPTPPAATKASPPIVSTVATLVPAAPDAGLAAPMRPAIGKASPAKPEPVVAPPQPLPAIASKNEPAAMQRVIQRTAPAALAPALPATPPAALPERPATVTASRPPLPASPPKYNDLMTAVLSGDAGAVEELVQLGKWPDKRDARGATPLMAAAEAGNTRIAEILLEAGANPNLQTSGGQTAAAIARRRGDTAMLGLLVRHSGR